MMRNICIVVINLDSNVDRMRNFMVDYDASDVGKSSDEKVELRRFSGVEMHDDDALKSISPAAAHQLEETQRTGQRIRHSDLSTGAVGCFLSHVMVMMMLLDDDVNDTYIIMEDDALIPVNMREKIDAALHEAPSDWDILLLGHHLLEFMDHDNDQGTLPPKERRKVKTFWGTHAYLINKKGAMKFIYSYKKDNIIFQIDSQMSMLSRAGGINIYLAYKADVVTRYQGSDIQLPLVELDDVDPYEITT